MTIYATACAACMAACACALAADAPANTAKAPQSTVSPSASCYLARPDVVEFLGQISDKHGIPLEWLKDEVAVARYSETAERLMTLSFDYTRRAAFFKEELAHFLEFCWRQEVQPVTVLGSFAGAIGYGQFMPSSLDRWGADGDKDGRIDMVESEPDAIASVARFLTAHGWVAGRGLLYPVRADAEIFDATGSGGIAAHATVEGLRKAGVDTGEHFPLLDDEPVLLVDLPQLDEKGRRTTKWYIGTRNFSSVLRYNRSYFYAAAVAMLANRIAGIDEP